MDEELQAFNASKQVSEEVKNKLDEECREPAIAEEKGEEYKGKPIRRLAQHDRERRTVFIYPVKFVNELKSEQNEMSEVIKHVNQIVIKVKGLAWDEG